MAQINVQAVTQPNGVYMPLPRTRLTGWADWIQQTIGGVISDFSGAAATATLQQPGSVVQLPDGTYISTQTPGYPVSGGAYPGGVYPGGTPYGTGAQVSAGISGSTILLIGGLALLLLTMGGKK